MVVVRVPRAVRRVQVPTMKGQQCCQAYEPMRSTKQRMSSCAYKRVSHSLHPFRSNYHRSE